MNNIVITPFLVALIATALFIPICVRAAHHINLVDKPGGRKRHEEPVPLVGGLAIFYVFFLLSFASPFVIGLHWTFYIGAAFLLYIGLIDDLDGANPWIKFFTHVFVAGLAVLVGDVAALDLGNLFGLGPFTLGPFSTLFSVAAIVLLMNAMNLSDGLDGLAGGQSFIIFGWLMLICSHGSHYVALPSLALMMGCIAGFLLFNMRTMFRKKASIFLGDAGSVTLGFTIAWFTIMLSKGGSAPVEPITIAWILAVPIFDICAQFYRRMRSGKHPFTADRGHFHHHLVNAGWSVKRAVYLMLLLNIIAGAIGYFGNLIGVPHAVLTILWIVGLLTHIAVSENPERYIALFKKLRAMIKESFQKKKSS